MSRPVSRRPPASRRPYILDDQIGFVLRQVNQRHVAIFEKQMGGDLTPTQWAALSKLAEVGSCSQNQLGRLTAMDVATIKGVIDRLTARGLTRTNADPDDGRRLLVALTPAGRQRVAKGAAKAFQVTEDTLAPLEPAERETLKTLLLKLR